jgi:5-methylcytosine-specific restriction endonuclease McrA
MLAGLKAFYNHCCAYCDENPEALQIDHIQPLSKGGKHRMDNVLPACRGCNRRKWVSEPDEWFATINRKFAFDGTRMVRVS